MSGYFYSDPQIKYLVNKNWMVEFLLDHNIPIKNIVFVNSFMDLKKIFGYSVILPIQRSKLDILALRFLRRIQLKTFIHDLHFMSTNNLLKKEFVGKKIALKRYIYLIVIHSVDQIFVNSNLVKRQVMILLKKESTLKSIKRVFVFNKNEYNEIKNVNKTIDYFIPLSDRDYKGFWVLDRIKFEKPDAKVLVDKKYFDRAEKLLRKKNPNIRLLMRDLSLDIALAKTYSSSTATLCLSRFEGFGFLPYEAGSFGSIPIVFDCSAYIEVPDEVFLKLKIGDNIGIPSVDHLSFPKGTKKYSNEHIVHIVN